ncbi:MAG: type II toxin-antitoxin system HicB family antitoxin [Chloroflexi bacterium]|nr:type II toxin-antitoxin system HicB family antitoxin [Chloroflexota bacterium]MCI0562365.1 type II toxin-antitoxin system HicB family antitoxin [Nitrososphaera sp.]
MVKVVYRAEVFKEDDQYVGLCPELDVSSFGDTPEEAMESLQEAVEAFLEGCEYLGTLAEVIEESGIRIIEAS